jgi:phosphoribosylamine---glycine ligase
MLAHMDLRWYPEHVMTVVMAARGYPGEYGRGSEIRGLGAAAEIEGVTVFHAGTRIRDGRVFADGGRVLDVTGSGATLEQARERAYAAIERIDWPEGFCRRDIGWRVLGGAPGAYDSPPPGPGSRMRPSFSRRRSASSPSRDGGVIRRPGA